MLRGTDHRCRYTANGVFANVQLEHLSRAYTNLIVLGWSIINNSWWYAARSSRGIILLLLRLPYIYVLYWNAMQWWKWPTVELNLCVLFSLHCGIRTPNTMVASCSDQWDCCRPLVAIETKKICGKANDTTTQPLTSETAFFTFDCLCIVDYVLRIPIQE